MAGPLVLRTAIGTYPYTRPLKDGSVSSPRLHLEQVEVVPANRAFRPMVNQLAYDASELALVTLLLAKAYDRPLVGVPVVLMQQSAYGMFAVRADSPLHDPRQLVGRTIGVRAYTQTTGVWLRGMLDDQFGLDADRLSWLTFEPSHVDGFIDPPNARPAPPGATLVVQRDIVTHHPWVVDELGSLVQASKRATGGPAPVDGLQANRDALNLLARYTFAQHITPRTLTVEELFPIP